MGTLLVSNHNAGVTLQWTSGVLSKFLKRQLGLTSRQPHLLTDTHSNLNVWRNFVKSITFAKFVIFVEFATFVVPIPLGRSLRLAKFHQICHFR